MKSSLKPVSYYGKVFSAVLAFCTASMVQSQSLLPSDTLIRISGSGPRIEKHIIFPEPADLSGHLGLSVRVSNTGAQEFRIEAWMNNNKWAGSSIHLAPGETDELQLFIMRRKDPSISVFPGMKGWPGGTVSNSPVNPTAIEKVILVVYAEGTVSLNLSAFEPYGRFIPPVEVAGREGFYPFIDRFGQYKHEEWRGKVTATDDLTKAALAEVLEIHALPAPEGRNRFGGWDNSPRLEATGNFRTEKVNGKWWLVDPEGCLFWSHGITCISFRHASTRISGRTEFFDALPSAPDPLYAFFTASPRDTSYNFYSANLYRKYGEEWSREASRRVPMRLKSWGMNSYGNWSDPGLYLDEEVRIPYTVGVSSGSGRTGFPEVFDPSFRASLKRSLEALDPRVFTDPWCIGFFIDNELNVSDITRSVMALPAGSTTRRMFLESLKTNYRSIKNLNTAWNTDYPSFSNLDTLTRFPAGSASDRHRFERMVMENYYRICREELKLKAPGKIYFGSRLHCHFFPDDTTENDIIRIAAQYCDVVCFNRYRFTPEDLLLPFGIDKPTLIGEFHFGALDRGLPYQGMRNVANQEQRAEAYYQYVTGALKNPQLVGTHWFQYTDLPFTGRNDGANAQVGFVTITDHPYPELIDAARRVSYPMYEMRYGVENAR
jgi:hypothetical protein